MKIVVVQKISAKISDSQNNVDQNTWYFQGYLTVVYINLHSFNFQVRILKKFLLQINIWPMI